MCVPVVRQLQFGKLVLVESDLIRMPLSIKFALILWAIVGALFFYMAYGVANEPFAKPNWGAVGFWLFWAAVVVLNMWGLLRRTTAGWWWNKQCTNCIAALTTIPFVLAVVFLIYRLTGGTVEDEMSYLASVLTMIGLIMLLPAVLSWGLFFAVRSKSAREYCRVCPCCIRRIRAPIQLLFDQFGCDLCQSTSPSSMSDKFHP